MVEGKKWTLVVIAEVDDSFKRTEEEVYKQLMPRMNQGFMNIRDGITITCKKMQLSEDGLLKVDE